MCAIVDDRIRINKIMSLTLSMRLDCRSANLDELAHLCVVALQLFMMELVPKSVWRRGRATLLPGTLPGSAVNRRPIGTPDRHPIGTPSFYVSGD